MLSWPSFKAGRRRARTALYTRRTAGKRPSSLQVSESADHRSKRVSIFAENEGSQRRSPGMRVVLSRACIRARLRLYVLTSEVGYAT